MNIHLIDLFCTQARTNAARVDLIPNLSAAQPLIQEHLEQSRLPPSLHLTPELAEQWPATGLPCSSGTTQGEHRVCVSRAWAATADTGSLILRSGPHNPTRPNFLADLHLVVLSAHRIAADKTTLWRWLAEEPTLPRAIHFISGPSRTADIEQTIQLGAHGPRQLWILLETGPAI